MALNLFDDESLTLGEEARPAREVYVPSFFTSHPQPVNNNLPEHARPGRDAQVMFSLSLSQGCGAITDFLK